MEPETMPRTFGFGNDRVLPLAEEQLQTIAYTQILLFFFKNPGSHYTLLRAGCKQKVINGAVVAKVCAFFRRSSTRAACFPLFFHS
jgi:hypothetical protein